MADGLRYRENQMAPAEAFGQVANTMGGIMRDSARMQYQIWLHNKEMELKQQEINQRGALNQAQIPYYQNRAKSYAGEESLRQQQMSNADRVSRAAWAMQMMRDNPELIDPATRAKLQADMAGAQAGNAALYSQGAERLATPVVLSKGQEASNFWIPGNEPIRGAPDYEKLGAGDILVNPRSGQTVAESPHVGAGGGLGSFDSTILNFLAKQDELAGAGAEVSDLYPQAKESGRLAIENYNRRVQAGGQQRTLTQPPPGSGITPTIFGGRPAAPAPYTPGSRVPIPGLNAPPPLSLEQNVPYTPPQGGGHTPTPTAGPSWGERTLAEPPPPPPNVNIMNAGQSLEAGPRAPYNFMNPPKQQQRQVPTFQTSLHARRAGLKDGDTFYLPDGRLARLKPRE